MSEKEINFFAETTFRNQRKKFGIKIDDRRRHMYVVGKTGMGKTNLLENMAVQDIRNGHGMGFVDPHGEAAERLLDFVPASRINDVIYINPGDVEYPIAFNIVEKVDIEHRHLIAAGLMGVFKKIWPDVWSARMEYILNNCILALLEFPGATLLGVNRMFSDPEYRKKVIERVTDPVVKAFWLQEYARYTQRLESEATAAIQNKIGQFISSPLIRNIIGQVKSTIDIKEAMDSEKILIMNLSKGRVGEDSSRLLGALMITKLQLAAMQRVDTPEEERKDFFLYIDEFQNFATESFVNILSEARKYRLALILGHQYIAQMEDTVRDAVFGNIGTLVTFRVGAEDAEFLERELSPEFMAADLVGLGKYNIYLKLMIDGLAGRPFSAKTLAPFPKEEKSNMEKIIKVSRERYGNPRKEVEEKIGRWVEVAETEAAAAPKPFSGALYDATCSSCGKPTKVTFQPDGVRPVYCKPCRAKLSGKPPDKIKTEEEAVPELQEKEVQAEPQKQEQKAEVPAPKEEKQESGLSLEEAVKRGAVPFAPARRQQEERQATPPPVRQDYPRPRFQREDQGRRGYPRQDRREERRGWQPQRSFQQRRPAPADTEDLKKVLDESLKKQSPQAKEDSQNKDQGLIKPGETVKF